jgi:antitoxin YefM
LTSVREGVRCGCCDEKELSTAVITASQARAKLYRLIDQTAESHEPIVITGKRANAVLVSEEDWSAIQETLFLLSVPGMRETIKEGMSTPVEECDKALDW